MNQSSKKTIEAIVNIEVEKFEELLKPWIISKNDSHFNYIRLYSGIKDEEIGSVMLAACSLSSEKIVKENSSETLKAFISDEGFVLEGGLLFKENDEVKVSSGCCGGLEDWFEWLDVPNGNIRIWTGHNPESLVEMDSGLIKIWNDRENKDEKFSTEFSAEEMFENLKFVEKDLKDFLVSLAEWTKDIELSLEKQVVNHFAKNMHIEN